MSHLVRGVVRKSGDAYGVSFPRLRGPAFAIVDDLDKELKPEVQWILQTYFNSNGIDCINPEPENIDNEYNDLLGTVECIVDKEEGKSCVVVIGDFQPL